MKQVIVDFGTRHLLGAEIPLRVHGYGLMLVLGFLLGIHLARWRARRAGENPDILKGAITAVPVEAVLAEVVRHVDLRPPVAIEVGRDRPETIAGRVLEDPRPVGNVLEGTVSPVAEQAVGHTSVGSRRAVVLGAGDGDDSL